MLHVDAAGDSEELAEFAVLLFTASDYCAASKRVLEHLAASGGSSCATTTRVLLDVPLLDRGSGDDALGPVPPAGWGSVAGAGDVLAAMRTYGLTSLPAALVVARRGPHFPRCSVDDAPVSLSTGVTVPSSSSSFEQAAALACSLQTAMAPPLMLPGRPAPGFTAEAEEAKEAEEEAAAVSAAASVAMGYRAFNDQGDLPAAALHFSHALWRRVEGQSLTDAAYNLGVILHTLGRPLLAVPFLKQVSEGKQDAAGKDGKA